MKLSILDQSPVSVGMTEKDALEASIQLAQHGETFGYERYWIAEHHDLFGLACPNPSVMISAIGSRTKTIRIGAGAVLLPYYKPFHVAETYHLLGTLFPGRIDLGLGRAPGGSAEVSLALTDNYLAEVRKFPEQVDALHAFLYGGFSEDDPNAKITPTPVPKERPRMWMLGTSEKSALLAAEKGLDYVFGHFMTDADGPEVVSTYREKQHTTGDVIVAVHVICGETTAVANELALSYFLWKIRQDRMEEDVRVPSVEEALAHDWTAEDQKKVKRMKQQMIIGSKEVVGKEMMDLDARYEADEYMIVTIVHDAEVKRKSYTLLKDSVEGLK